MQSSGKARFPLTHHDSATAQNAFVAEINNSCESFTAVHVFARRYEVKSKADSNLCCVYLLRHGAYHAWCGSVSSIDGVLLYPDARSR